MRAISKFFWTILAVIFLIEAWLWDHLAPVVAWIVKILPLARLKEAIARGVEKLNPYVVLFIFIIPLAAPWPFKLGGLWLIARGHIITGTIIFGIAEVVGAALAAFLLETCKPKLMEMAWFARVYTWVAGLVHKAHALVDPIKTRLKAWVRALRGKTRGSFMRRIFWLRRSAYERETTAKKP